MWVSCQENSLFMTSFFFPPNGIFLILKLNLGVTDRNHSQRHHYPGKVIKLSLDLILNSFYCYYFGQFSIIQQVLFFIDRELARVMNTFINNLSCWKISHGYIVSSAYLIFPIFNGYT